MHERIQINFPFLDQSHVRSYDWQGKRWYRAADICKLLGVEDTRRAAAQIPLDYRRKLNLSDPRGVVQETWVVDLTGLLLMVITSRKPIATLYHEWIARSLSAVICTETKGGL